MVKRTIRAGIALLFVLVGAGLFAQGWTLKDIGVGLIVQDENYDRELRVMRRGSQWDLQELYEKGAMAGKYDGKGLFAAWIVGPPNNANLKASGMPLWNFSYMLT